MTVRVLLSKSRKGQRVELQKETKGVSQNKKD